MASTETSTSEPVLDTFLHLEPNVPRVLLILAPDHAHTLRFHVAPDPIPEDLSCFDAIAGVTPRSAMSRGSEPVVMVPAEDCIIEGTCDITDNLTQRRCLTVQCRISCRMHARVWVLPLSASAAPPPPPSPLDQLIEQGTWRPSATWRSRTSRRLGDVLRRYHQGFRRGTLSPTEMRHALVLLSLDRMSRGQGEFDMDVMSQYLFIGWYLCQLFQDTASHAV